MSRNHTGLARVGGWAAAMLCVVLGAGAGLWVHDQLPRTWAASTSVLVLPTVAGLESSISGSRANGAVEIDTEVELARSAQVSQRASEALDGRMGAAELLTSTTVSVPTNSTVLLVQVEADSPELARDAATAVAQAYLDRREEQAQAEVDEVLDQLTTRVDDLSSRLQEIATTLGTLNPTDSSGRALAESQRSVLVSQLADVNSRIVALQSGTSRGGEIITAAEVPQQPVSPQLWVDVGAGLLGGLLVGGLVLIAVEKRGAMRTAARRRDAAQRDLGPFDLDAAEEASVGGLRGSLALQRLLQRVEAYRSGHDGPDVVVVVAPADIAQRVLVVLNAAWARDRGSNVLVVPQQGVLEPFVGVGAPGLSDVLRGDVTAEEAVRRGMRTAGALLGPGRGASQLPPAALRAKLADVWSSLRQPEQGVLVALLPPLDSVVSQSVLRTAGRILAVVHPSGADEDVFDLFEDIDFLGLSERVVGTVDLVTTHAPLADGAQATMVTTAPTDAGDREALRLGSGRA